MIKAGEIYMQILYKHVNDDKGFQLYTYVYCICWCLKENERFVGEIDAYFIL